MLVVSVFTYYCFFYFIQHGITIYYGMEMTFLWGAIGAVSGGAFGYAGAVWKTGSRRNTTLAVALLSGALVAEALVLLAVEVTVGSSNHSSYRYSSSHDLSYSTGEVMMLVELIIGLLLPIIMVNKKEQLRTVAITAVTGLAGVVVVGGVRTFMWMSGWHGH